MRDRIKSISGDEPIQEEKSETPIIDGVPNDQNDRPILDGIIEEPDDDNTKHAADKDAPDSDSDQASDEKHVDKPVDPEPEPVDPKPADPEPAKKPTPEKTQQTEDDDTPVKSEPKPIHTEAAKPDSKALGGGVPIRVMFIGASMTLGDPPQAAYRKQLREWMVSLGNQVNCVGVVRHYLLKHRPERSSG